MQYKAQLRDALSENASLKKEMETITREMKFTSLAELKAEIKELRSHSIKMSQTMLKMKEHKSRTEDGFHHAYRLYVNGDFREAEE